MEQENNYKVTDKVEIVTGRYKGLKAVIEKITIMKGIKVRILYDDNKNVMRIDTIEGLKETDLIKI